MHLQGRFGDWFWSSKSRIPKTIADRTPTPQWVIDSRTCFADNRVRGLCRMGFTAWWWSLQPFAKGASYCLRCFSFSCDFMILFPWTKALTLFCLHRGHFSLEISSFEHPRQSLLLNPSLQISTSDHFLSKSFSDHFFARMHYFWAHLLLKTFFQKGICTFFSNLVSLVSWIFSRRFSFSSFFQSE